MACSIQKLLAWIILIILTITPVLAEDFEQYKQNLEAWKGTDTTTTIPTQVIQNISEQTLNPKVLIGPVILLIILATIIGILYLYKDKIKSKIEELNKELEKQEKKNRKEKKEKPFRVRYRNVNPTRILSKAFPLIMMLYVGNMVMSTMAETLNGTVSPFYQGLSLVGFTVSESGMITGYHTGGLFTIIAIIGIVTITMEIIDIKI